MLVIHKIYVTVAAVAGCVMSACEPAEAQGGPPMITDDPGTVSKGHWEINIAALTNRASDATTYQLPLIDMNYGATERVQLKYEVPWIVTR